MNNGELVIVDGPDDTGIATAIHAKYLSVFRIHVGLAAQRVAGREPHEKRRVRGKGEMRWRLGADQRTDRAQIRGLCLDKGVVAARVECDE